MKNISEVISILNEAAREIDNEEMTVTQRAYLVSRIRDAADYLSDCSRGVKVVKVYRDSDDVLGGSDPKDVNEILESLGRCLDKACMTSTVLFKGSDERLYVATFEGHIGLASPDFVEGEGLVECQNCDWWGESDEQDDIKDLHERVSDGEPMPAGQCPKCGALTHRVLQAEG